MPTPSPSAPERCEPLLRWAGSKRQLRARLHKYWRPSFVRYVEPFAGSCSLFFWLAPARAILSDKNPELVEVYRVLAQRPDELHRAASYYPSTKGSYYTLRSLDTTHLPPLARAARFVFLNRYCFNGIYRTNRAGRFNVPFSPSKTGALPSVESFRACARALSGASLHAADFGSVLRHTRPGDFVYLDPPYATSKRRVFTEYGPRPFDRSDLDRLKYHLLHLDSRGVAFVLSYADCPELRTMCRKWRFQRVVVRRNIAGFQNARRHARELIVSNIRAD